MSSLEPDIAERQARMIARMGEITLAAAEVVQERLLAAETPEATERLAVTLHKLGRGLRQCLLVENKLAREARAMAREDEAAAAKAGQAEVQARKAAVRGEVARVAVEGCETSEDADALLDDLDLWVETWFRAGAFETLSPAELADLLCNQLDITFAPGEVPPWRSGREPGPAPSAVPAAPRLVQQPDFGWAPSPDSS